jgi:hypothetical protein
MFTKKYQNMEMDYLQREVDIVRERKVKREKLRSLEKIYDDYEKKIEPLEKEMERFKSKEAENEKEEAKSEVRLLSKEYVKRREMNCCMSLFT